jgi:uncharacterized protein (DUF2249 family)
MTSMNLADKIKEFKDIEGLISEIESDKTTRDILSRRFPARLIFLQKFETLKLLIERLSSIGIECYHLEKDLPHSDGWITKDILINRVKNITEDTVMVPFSEMVRFYSGPDFKNVFNQLLLVENTDLSKRIYLPLIGIEERFDKDFFRDFTRKEESAPFWKISKEEPDSIKVFLTTNDYRRQIANFELIKNTEEWLKFWKRNSLCDIICYSKPLNLFYKNTLPDTIFKIDQFNNQKKLIEKIFGIEIPIPFVEKEKKYWDELSSLINSDYTTFISFVKRHFKVTILTTNNLLDNWLKTDNFFEKWLLQHFVLSQNCLEGKYLFKVFESMPDYSDQTLLTSLYKKIFVLDTKEEFVNERFELIKQFANLKPINLCDEVKTELNENIRSLPDFRQALLLTTGLFPFEKTYIFELFVKDHISDFELLSKRFPDILDYSSEVPFENLTNEQEWVLAYLIDYKKSKLLDNISDHLNELLSEVNGDEKAFYSWYHSFDSIHSLIHINKVDKVFWIDALGIEWVSFIENYLKRTNKELKVIKKLVGIANLPSSTEQNRFLDSKYIQDFDAFIHNNPYSYPNSIINEFNEIKRILDTYIILDSGQTIAIVSDHGLSALSRLVESKKYGKNDSHEGRFINIKRKEHVLDSDYIIHKSEVDQKNYLIALKHNSLGIKPKREVHGGCTPEEVLVPLIIISNKKDLAQVEYVIIIDKTEITRKEPLISITISPDPQSAYLQIAGKKQKLRYNNISQKWETIIDKSLSGKVTIKIIVEKTEQSFVLNILSGFIEEDLF